MYQRYDGIRWRLYKRDLRRACPCLAPQLFLVHAPSLPTSTTMKATPSDSVTDRKGHICPPSHAKHPSDRWESLFIYGFICRFTQLRTKVEGFNSPMECVLRCSSGPDRCILIITRRFTSFEDALLSPEPNLIMTQILARFVLNLRPGTRNLRCVWLQYAIVLVKHVLLMYCVLQL